MGNKVILLALLIVTSVHAKEFTSTGADFVRDSDASSQIAPYVGYTNKSLDNEYSVRAGIHSYDDKTYPSIMGRVSLHLTKELDTSLKIGIKSDIIGHADITYTSTNFNANLSYERDVVDTEEGLKDGITNRTIGGYTDLKISNSLTLTAGVFSQQNSDNVDSSITILKATYVINDSWKMELVQKNIDRTIPTGYTPSYFHPEVDDKTLIRAHYAVEINEHNHLTLTGGIGKRDLKYETTDLYEYGMKWVSTLTESVKLNVKISCFEDTNNYQYCAGGINFDFYQ
jgi:hypothetical protein